MFYKIETKFNSEIRRDYGTGANNVCPSFLYVVCIDEYFGIWCSYKMSSMNGLKIMYFDGVYLNVF